MKINPTGSVNISNENRQSFKKLPAKPLYLPEGIGRLAKVTGTYVSTPEQKLFLATTALMCQPLIDLKFAQEDKQTDSAIKSAAKAIAGGFTGVAIRAGSIALFKKFVGFDLKPLNPYFFPKSLHILYEKKPALAELRLDQYQKTMGTIFAVAFMILYSNKNWDVPLTNDLQDLLSGVIKEDKTWLRSLSDVLNNRKQITQDKIDGIKQKVEELKVKMAKINKIIKGEPVSYIPGEDKKEARPK